MSRRLGGLPLWWIVLTGIVFAGLIHQAWGWWRAAGLNRAMASPELIAVDEDTPAPLRFAKARALSRTERTGEAAQLYASLLQDPSPSVRERANYNLGTLYLKDAAKFWNERGVLEYARVNTLVELAKENFRQSLRLNPDNWDARYNLEYAFRITPPPKEKAKSDWRGSKSSVFSTLPGIPGGGP
jgi:mxaK protein